MADYGAIADAIAARFLGTPPPTGQSAIRMSTADLPNAITVVPAFLVYEPDDQWMPGPGGGRRGVLTYRCRLVLPQSDEPRTQRAALDWRSALLSRLDGYSALGGGLNVHEAIVINTATGTLAYAGQDWPSVEVTVRCTVAEAMSA